jgi:hypothetical protein
MATAAECSRTGRTANLPGRRFDHVFFTSTALVMLVTVFVGFAHTYYLAGLFRAPLPSGIIHVHGAVFSCWILLLVAQTSLVSAGRVDIHRRLGVAGFFLGCLVIVLGVVAATDALARGAPAGRDPQMFYIVGLTDILIFSGSALFRLPHALGPARAQAIHLHRDHCAADSRNRALAVRFRVPEVSGCSFARRELFARLGWLRSMAYAPDPSGDAVGRLFPDISAANSISDWKDRGLARVRRLGATPGSVRVHVWAFRELNSPAPRIM